MTPQDLRKTLDEILNDCILQSEKTDELLAEYAYWKWKDEGLFVSKTNRSLWK